MEDPWRLEICAHWHIPSTYNNTGTWQILKYLVTLWDSYNHTGKRSTSSIVQEGKKKKTEVESSFGDFPRITRLISCRTNVLLILKTLFIVVVVVVVFIKSWPASVKSSHLIKCSKMGKSQDGKCQEQKPQSDDSDPRRKKETFLSFMLRIFYRYGVLEVIRLILICLLCSIKPLESRVLWNLRHTALKKNCGIIWGGG